MLQNQLFKVILLAIHNEDKWTKQVNVPVCKTPLNQSTITTVGLLNHSLHLYVSEKTTRITTGRRSKQHAVTLQDKMSLEIIGAH